MNIHDFKWAMIGWTACFISFVLGEILWRSTTKKRSDDSTQKPERRFLALTPDQFARLSIECSRSQDKHLVTYKDGSMTYEGREIILVSDHSLVKRLWRSLKGSLGRAWSKLKSTPKTVSFRVKHVDPKTLSSSYVNHSVTILDDQDPPPSQEERERLMEMYRALQRRMQNQIGQGTMADAGSPNPSGCFGNSTRPLSSESLTRHPGDSSQP